nr:hypothetical protein [Bacteroides sp.]
MLTARVIWFIIVGGAVVSVVLALLFRGEKSLGTRHCRFIEMDSDPIPIVKDECDDCDD